MSTDPGWWIVGLWIDVAGFVQSAPAMPPFADSRSARWLPRHDPTHLAVVGPVASIEGWNRLGVSGNAAKLLLHHRAKRKR